MKAHNNASALLAPPCNDTVCISTLAAKVIGHTFAQRPSTAPCKILSRAIQKQPAPALQQRLGQHLATHPATSNSTQHSSTQSTCCVTPSPLYLNLEPADPRCQTVLCLRRAKQVGRTQSISTAQLPNIFQRGKSVNPISPMGS